MSKRWQFLCVPTPPSAAAESSKEVKLEKLCGRPILWSGGGTRILQYLWGRGKHDPSRHLSPDRRTRMGRIKISTMLLNTLMCGEIGRISRVDNFIDKNDVKFWLVSSFAIVSSFAKAAAEFYIWTIAWDTKISLTMRANLGDKRTNLGDNGKIWEMLPTAYRVRPHFWAYAFWSSKEPLFPGCGCVLIVDAYSSSRRRRRIYYLSCPPEAKNRCILNCSKSSKFDKNSL